MNGAESLVYTLLQSGIDTCFANPGTSEMHFVAALDRIPGMRCVLALAEGVATGAADGYGRMADKPASTLLHCGPGLANGLSNLHNARRAQSPIVNIVGDQATYHAPLDAPLSSDTEGWARPVSAWTRTARHVRSVGVDAAAAVQAARSAPGHIATLVLPSDASWDEGGSVAAPLLPPPPARVPQAIVERIASVLRSGEPALLFLGGRALRLQPAADAYRIVQASGCRVLAQQANGRIERGLGRAHIAKLPYAVSAAVEALAGVKHLVLVGAPAPVGFFAYPGKPGLLAPPEATVHVLARPDQDVAQALADLADALDAPRRIKLDERARPEPAMASLSSQAVGQTLAALLPEQAILVDESVSFGRSFYAATEDAAPHDWLQITGGAIGCGIPLATGAAIAAPGRRVVSMQADGAAMYSLQGLWTQARERLDVTTVILSNRKYAILLGEYANVGATPGKTAHDMLSLTNPDLDWIKLAGGMGVEGARATSIEAFADLFVAANRRKGPFLIELLV
ncbi:acetolactate synthase large subunit [Bradyrhizobium sp. USDA 4452]